MADRPDSFIARWSRRKRAPRDEDRPAAEPAETAAPVEPPSALPESAESADPTVAADPDEAVAGDPEVIAKLPDIESLNEASDFKPFMAKGVPEVLRRRALRKLWRLNPVFAHLDGLNDYDQDFRDAAMVLPNLKTIYKVGRGMLGEVEPEPQAEATGSGTNEPVAPEAAKSLAPPALTAGPASVESPAQEAVATIEVARQETADQPGAPAEVAVSANEDDKSVGGDTGQTATRRRHAASRRWGESSK
jgi:Protein of unknown function (DUF3306)